jgi:hypothetical protein
MFFRRPQPRQFSFDDRLQKLRDAGFTVTPLAGGRVQVSRGGSAVVLEDVGGSPSPVGSAGVLLNGEIAELVDGGFQKFLQTATGKRRPALASDLEAIHKFQEDLAEALGWTTLYNQALGTVSTRYLYDRLKDRDRGVPKRAWE